MRINPASIKKPLEIIEGLIVAMLGSFLFVREANWIYLLMLSIGYLILLLMLKGGIRMSGKTKTISNPRKPEIFKKTPGIFYFQIFVFIILIIFLLISFNRDIFSNRELDIKPAIIFNTLNDANKEAPDVYNVTLAKYEEDGFRLKWEEGEGWKAIGWKLRYTNFKNKNDYAIYYIGKAEKEGKIVTLNLTDDNGNIVSIHLDLETKFTENTIRFSDIEECLEVIKENGNERVESRDVDYFQWEQIHCAELERYYESNEANEVIFKKLMIGLIN